MILAHNHPSGDPEPSEEDLGITKRLVEAGELVGIGCSITRLLPLAAWFHSVLGG